MLKTSLEQKLTQKLAPQQIQMIKLLELNTLQLEERIKNEIEENPALDDGGEGDYDDGDSIVENDSDVLTNEEERDDGEQNSEDEYTREDDYSLDDDYGANDDDEIPNYRLEVNNTSKDDDRVEMPYSASKSFNEHLFEQFILKDVTERQKFIAPFLVGNIDEDGYLRRDLDAVADDIAFSQNIEVSEKELEDVLKVIQELDPAGIGARSLQECLLIQLRRKEEQTNGVKTAIVVLSDCFEEFTKKHYEKIMQKCNITEQDLKEAIDVIIKLNPKPGNSYGEPQKANIQAIIPDFIVEVEDNDIAVSLNNRNSPDLRISRSFSKMMDEYSSDKAGNKEVVTFVKQKIDNAKWFIDAIEQRRRTLLYTMEAIVQFQRKFFLTGDEADIRPMILKDIAEMTNLDISTVSRVANSKYVATPYGNFLLKFFFSEAMQTDSGEEVSTREVKQILKECIDAEDTTKPLTDDRLSEILKDRGYIIARRTIAKYREQMGIPVARLRRKI
ncbi:MAG: RNA polymerase factor sigma-54 [Bacteroidales bacterium]|nr:RNA polymerase factor sigma-54 [Bacteroidales bacterium]